MMDSTKNKKPPKVFASRRRISSILNQSPTKLNASKGDVTRRINVLIKNNKTLATALQDARCELSSKQSLFEKANEYFKNIMLARVRMIEMESALNSVLQDFSGTIQMLKVDNFKLSDITAPFQSTKKFKSKMKKLAQTIEAVNEEHSFLSEQENEKSVCEKSPKPAFPSSICSSAPMEVTENTADKTSSKSETAIPQAFVKDCIPVSSPFVPIMPGSPGVKSEAMIDPDIKKEITLISADSLIVENGTGTPKLSLPIEITAIDLQKSPKVAFSLLKENDLPVVKLSTTTEKKSGTLHNLPKDKILSLVKKPSKIPEKLCKPKSFKILNSKIPRFHAASNTAIKDTSFLNEISKEKLVCSKICDKKNVCIPKEPNEVDSRRKTFVVKNSDPEIDVNLNEEEVIDCDNLDEQNSETFSSRKTFVVRSTSALEKKRKSVSNKRKTFVKKSNNSLKNKRGTFVVTKIDENCSEDELLTAHPVNSDCDDFGHEETNKPCATTVVDKVLLSADDLCETTQSLQLLKKKCFIIDNPKIMDQESNSGELRPEINSEGTLKKNFESSPASEKKYRSVDDKRKTFVQKCNKNNSHKSIQNKRGTFALKLTDLNENCVEEDQLSTNMVNSEGDNLVKEKLNEPCAMVVGEALPSASNASCEVTQNLQQLKKKCFMKDNTKMMNQENDSEKLLPEVSSERALKKNSSDLSGIKNFNKSTRHKEDIKVKNVDEKNGEIDDLKSVILPQKPSLKLPVQADSTINEVSRIATVAKASKEEKNSCTTDGMECNNENLLLKNSNKRKTCIVVTQDKHCSTSKIRAPEIESTIPQPTSKEPTVHCSNKAKGESVGKFASEKSKLEKEGNNNKKEESSFKSKETNEVCKNSIKQKNFDIDKDETNKKNLWSVDHISDDEIIILDCHDNKRRSRSGRIISYSKFLEPSYSDYESISDIDLETFEKEINPPLIKTPIRGKLSFSKKKQYVFERETTAKIKTQKSSNKPKNCKNLSNKASASSQNKNCEGDNSNTNLNKISENVGNNNLLQFANADDGKKETDVKRHVTFFDAQETLLNDKKITENLNDKTKTDFIEIQNNSVPEILDLPNDKNGKILSPNYSPVISLDQCLNTIECDIEDKNMKPAKTNSTDKITPKMQNTETNKTNKTKKQITDSVKDKTSKKKEAKRKPNKQKKQVIESNLGKENMEDTQVNNQEEVKPSSQNNKAKNCRQKELKDNKAIVVEAEIHPLPRTLNQLDTNIGSNKNYEVAVVLSDIFHSINIDFLPVNHKEKRDRNCIISSPLSNNSSNIQMQGTSKSTAAKEEEKEDLTEFRRSKRARAVNYAEPPLHKKMRR